MLCEGGQVVSRQGTLSVRPAIINALAERKTFLSEDWWLCAYLKLHALWMASVKLFIALFSLLVKVVAKTVV